jgi:translation elongation factor EF-Tu-like GTPase
MRTRTTTATVTNATGIEIQTSIIQYPTVEDVLGVLARSVVREKVAKAASYVAPSVAVQNSLFRFE